MAIKGKKGKNKKSSGIIKNHSKRSFELKGKMEEYGKVSKKLGDKRVIVVLVDSREVLAHIPGRFTKKKIWVDIDSVVLVSQREFEADKMDIIHMYQYDEVKKLVKIGEIPDSFLQSGTSQLVTENIQNEEGFDIENSDDETDKNQVESKHVTKFVSKGCELSESKLDCGFDFDEI